MAFCEVESEIDREFDLGVASDDGFAMNLMSNENITWTVERERGISFDLTALTDPDCRQPDGGAFLDLIRREVKLEAESGVKESTFGHPFGGQCRPQPRPAPPSPFNRGAGAGPPIKRMRLPSFELRDSSSANRHWEEAPEELQQHSARALGRTRSHSARPSAPNANASASFGPPATTSTSGRNKSASNSRIKAETREVRATGIPRRRHVGGVDTVALAAELGLVDSRRYCGRRNKGGTPHRVGAYTLDERAALIAKFHAKRGRRIWRKKIKYDCRKKLADQRPRLKGRFVTQEELEGLDKETLAKVTGLGPWPEETSDAEEEASDSSEGDSGPAAAAAPPSTRRCRRARKSTRREESKYPAKAKKPRSGTATAVAAAAAAAAAVAKLPSKLEATPRDQESEEEEEDIDDDCGSTSAASEESDKAGEEEDGDGAMKRMSSSCKVSAMFAVKTEADVDLNEQQQLQQLVKEEEDQDSVVKVEEYEPTDPIFGFMIDDIFSSNFNVVPSRDMPAGVAVN